MGVGRQRAADSAVTGGTAGRPDSRTAANRRAHRASKHRRDRIGRERGDRRIRRHGARADLRCTVSQYSRAVRRPVRGRGIERRPRDGTVGKFRRTRIVLAIGAHRARQLLRHAARPASVHRQLPRAGIDRRSDRHRDRARQNLRAGGERSAARCDDPRDPGAKHFRHDGLRSRRSARLLGASARRRRRHRRGGFVQHDLSHRAIANGDRHHAARRRHARGLRRSGQRRIAGCVRCDHARSRHSRYRRGRRLAKRHRGRLRTVFGQRGDRGRTRHAASAQRLSRARHDVRERERRD